ncbi:hypothetical protein BGZ94_002588 [Podila epigama]|nr:hypothetical protein BGZ94_002588 [Podila epigama]
MTLQDTIGFIGLGEIGVGIAINLQKFLSSSKAGNNLTVWNRSSGKTDPLKNLGAHVASSIQEVVSRSTIIFTSLSNDAAVESVYGALFEAAKARPDPIVFVETSTIYPTLATRLAKELATHSPQHTYLQGPVFGRPPSALAAQLVWVVAGDDVAIKRLEPYFGATSKATINLQTTDVARASAFKLVGNFLVVGTMELLAEGLTLAGKNDLGHDTVMKLVELLFPSPVWLGYGKLLIEASRPENTEGNSKVGGFPVTLGLKDVGHIQQLATDSGASLPIADVAHGHLREVQDLGYGDKDWTSIIKALE